MKNKLTKNDIDKIIPPKEKREAIEQSVRYEQEYEMSKRELEEIMGNLKQLAAQLSEEE